MKAIPLDRVEAVGSRRALLLCGHPAAPPRPAAPGRLPARAPVQRDRAAQRGPVRAVGDRLARPGRGRLGGHRPDQRVAGAGQGRLVDRLGQRRCLPPMAAVFAAALVGVVAVAGPGPAAVAATIGLAATAGAAAPPLGASMRVLWISLVGQGPAADRLRVGRRPRRAAVRARAAAGRRAGHAVPAGGRGAGHGRAGSRRDAGVRGLAGIEGTGRQPGTQPRPGRLGRGAGRTGPADPGPVAHRGRRRHRHLGDRPGRGGQGGRLARGGLVLARRLGGGQRRRRALVREQDLAATARPALPGPARPARAGLRPDGGDQLALALGATVALVGLVLAPLESSAYVLAAELAPPGP